MVSNNSFQFESQTSVLGNSILLTSSHFSGLSGLQNTLVLPVSFADQRGRQHCRCSIGFCVVFSSLFAVWHKYLVHCKANNKQWRQQKQRNSNKGYATWTWMGPPVWVQEEKKGKDLKTRLEKNNGLVLASVKAFIWVWSSKLLFQLKPSQMAFSICLSEVHVQPLLLKLLNVSQHPAPLESGITLTAQLGKEVTRDFPSTSLFLRSCVPLHWHG